MSTGTSNYLNNIPAATDLLSVSQGNIQGNFGALEGWIGQNHVQSTGGDTQGGKHNFVQMPAQVISGSNPFGGFLSGSNGNEVSLYASVPTAAPLTTVNELYINKSNGVNFTSFIFFTNIGGGVV